MLHCDRFPVIVILDSHAEVTVGWLATWVKDGEVLRFAMFAFGFRCFWTIQFVYMHCIWFISSLRFVVCVGKAVKLFQHCCLFRQVIGFRFPFRQSTLWNWTKEPLLARIHEDRKRVVVWLGPQNNRILRIHSLPSGVQCHVCEKSNVATVVNGNGEQCSRDLQLAAFCFVDRVQGRSRKQWERQWYFQVQSYEHTDCGRCQSIERGRIRWSLPFPEAEHCRHRYPQFGLLRPKGGHGGLGR